jgi:hypothetical protein
VNGLLALALLIVIIANIAQEGIVRRTGKVVAQKGKESRMKQTSRMVGLALFKAIGSIGGEFVAGLLLLS